MDYISLLKTETAGLIDIQVPSLANFPVGYRLFSFDHENRMNVETVAVRDVPDWDRYMDDYQAFALQNEYSFEPFDVEHSETFDQYVSRSFEHMIHVKMGGVLDSFIVEFFLSTSLYELLLDAETGKTVDLESLANRAPKSHSAGNAKGQDLDRRIEEAGLSVDEFKAIDLYDFILATVKIQFGAAFAFDRMEAEGTLAYFRFFLEELRGKKLVSFDPSAAASEPLSLIATLLEMLSGLLQEYFWERPYTGKVRIDLADYSIEEID